VSEAGTPAPGRRRPSGRAIFLLGLFVVAAVASRFWALGDRPLHHDESIHAYQSWTLSRGGDWRYDPAYHGPFLYYANALVYRLLGATDYTARVMPAIFGLILIAFAWPLRRWIGNGAAICYAVFVFASPHMSYFSRFIREDPYSLVFTLGTIVAFQLFLETDRARWLTLASVSFAFAGVTKENAYMTGVLFVAYGLLRLAIATARSRPRSAALAATWRWIVARSAPIFSAGMLFLVIWAAWYTGFGKHPGDWLAIPKAVKYWMGQHSIARIPGPWWYYFPQLVYYDTAIFLAALFAYARPEARRSSFLQFVGFWAVGSLALYGWAREKVPWLTVHPLLPLTVLAGVGVTGLWKDRARLAPKIALALIAVLFAVNTSGAYLANFRYGAHDLAREPGHAEILAYVQTTRDLVRELSVVRQAEQRVAPGQPVITVAGEASWPLTWYLRDVPTNWASRIDQASTPVIVADWDPEGVLEKQLATEYEAKRVPIRAWWFPEPQKEGNRTVRPTFRDLVRWWLFHEIWSPIGSQDATFFVRKDLGGTGLLQPLSIAVQDTSARDYPSEAVELPPARAWGRTGAGDGEFSEPRGLAADGEGNLYVADSKNSRIEVFDGNGRFLRAFGSRGNAEGQLNEACGVAVGPDGTVYVADTWNHRVVLFGPDGAPRGVWVDPDRGFFGPRSIVVSQGSIYVADTGNKRIVRFDMDGKVVGSWGEAGADPGQFVEPVGLAADAAGRLYVADTGNHRVQVFDGEGRFLRQFPVYGWKDFYTEPYIAVGPSESVFVTDSWKGRVAHYDASGTLIRSFKAEGWKRPTGVVLDPFGRVVVSDRETNRVYSWSLADLLK
jgi:uncharacterized protein (TIGR03663 family)